MKLSARATRWVVCHSALFSAPRFSVENGLRDFRATQGSNSKRPSIPRVGHSCGPLSTDGPALGDSPRSGCLPTPVLPLEPRGLERGVVNGSRKRIFEPTRGHAWSDGLGCALVSVADRAGA